MTALAFQDVWVEYGDSVILERLSLEVKAGAFVSVVGPSGVGKSTLLRLVLGQEAPARGRILLDGEPLVPEPGPDRGVVFQRYSVFPHMTVLKNVMFGLECSAPVLGKLYGNARKAAEEGRRRCCARWASVIASPPIPAPCPAACSSAWPWPRP